MNTIAQAMGDFIARHNLYQSDTPLLVMLSGGGDSVALLHLLAEGACITALHVNHQLRGEEADADEAFCAQLCKSLGIPLVVSRIDVASYASEHKLNLEDAGRILRYRAAELLLDEICSVQGVDTDQGRIVTAHTRDDRVENFFTRAIFGSGLGGLAGMAAQRGRIVRPLLDTDRSELRAWLEAQGHTWREDPSNADESRTRAFIRARIVPEAEKLRPNFRENLARTMDLVADDDRLLTSMALGFAKDFCTERQEGESISLDLHLMLTLDPVMARRVLRCAITETFDDASRLDASHLAAIVGGLDVLRQQIQAGEKLPPRKVLFARDIPPALRVQINCATIRVARIMPA
ncbi:MAG: tRNA lysidine(34) synthetase TilS [Coriobacteriia bacterium]|nr:tRNA lysidine(34) synthetase TilS [Coriobacteriia bacterium]MCL2537664.1 tRNA lysidine(34) synthetase TilS [Coriobacteriia bacterium]